MTEEEAAFATWSSPRRTESLKEGGKITNRKTKKTWRMLHALVSAVNVAPVAAATSLALNGSMRT